MPLGILFCSVRGALPQRPLTRNPAKDTNQKTSLVPCSDQETNPSTLGTRPALLLFPVQRRLGLHIALLSVLDGVGKQARTTLRLVFLISIRAARRRRRRCRRSLSRGRYVGLGCTALMFAVSHTFAKVRRSCGAGDDTTRGVPLPCRVFVPRARFFCREAFVLPLPPSPPRWDALGSESCTAWTFAFFCNTQRTCCHKWRAPCFEGGS